MNIGPHGSRSAVILPVVALVAAVALSGCGAFSSGGSKSADTLTYWSMWQRGEPQSQVLQHAIQQFERKQNVKVDVQWAGREVDKRVRAAANTGDVPDLTDNAVEALLAGSKAKMYEGLGSVYDKTIPGESHTVGDVIPSTYVKPYETQDGQPVVAPYTVTTTSIWYDGNKLPDVAANPPQTWAQFVALMQKMKADGQTPIAADGTIPDYNAYWLYELVERQLGPGWLRKAGEDRTGKMWSDPKFIDCAKRLETLVSNGFFAKGYQGSKLPAGQQAWAQGNANFLIMGSWAPADTKKVARKGIEYRSFPMPMPPNGVNTVESNLIGFGIPTKAHNKELAAKFIAFFMNKARMSGIATQADNLTPRKDVETPPTLTDVAKMLGSAAETNRNLDGLPAEDPEYYTAVFLPLDDKLFFGQISANKFVSQLQEQSVHFWKKNG